MDNCNVSVASCMWMHNGANMSGGGIKVNGSTPLAMSDCNLEGNRATKGGGVFAAVLSDVKIHRCGWHMNNATYGGGVFADSMISIAVVNSTFTKNSAVYGAGVFGQKCNTFECQTSRFESNTALTMGGGIALLTNGTLTLDKNNAFVTNKAAMGGGVYAEYGCPITSISSTWNDNGHGEQGGAIFIKNSPSLLLSNNSFASNNATHGGSVYASETLFVHVLGTVLTSNVAEQMGGGFALFSVATFHVNSTEFYMNSAMDGGAVYGSDVEFAMLSMTKWESNVAVTSGGALCLVASNLSISTSSFLMNEAGLGGAIKAEMTPIVSMNGTWHMNRASLGGGALATMSASALHMSYDAMHNNTALNGSGGAVHAAR
eukprot:3537486-Rhodomonas_salina.1